MSHYTGCANPMCACCTLWEEQVCEDARQSLDDSAALRAALKEAEDRASEAESAFMACAEAAGVTYDAEGRGSFPGPVDDVVRSIREDRRAVVKADDLEAALKAAEYERDAYKKAKEENDDRFIMERDTARERVRVLTGALKAADEALERADRLICKIESTLPEVEIVDNARATIAAALKGE